MTRGNSALRICSSGGYTLIEVVVSSALGMIVMVGVLTVFIWALRTGAQCRQYAWAQSSSVSSAQRVVSTIRSAMAIHAVDVSGDWVELRMPPTGRVARFSYERAVGPDDEGLLVFVSDVNDPTSPTNVVANGVTKVMTMPVRNVFERSGTHLMY